jgi:tetratricopeptide (TPR) repeat protein
MIAEAPSLAPNLKLDITDLSDNNALKEIGILINASQDARSSEGTKLALSLLDEFEKRQPAPKLAALTHYFRANAWHNNMQRVLESRDPWIWEQTERQHEILALRRALNHPAFRKLHKMHRCQILTNLASALSGVGRFIEAVELWDRALQLNPKFGMARGNRGDALSHYARTLYDSGHAYVMLTLAHAALRSARSKTAFFEEEYTRARAYFKAEEDHIAAHVSVSKIRRTMNLHEHSLGRGATEKRYRSWCLNSRLFVNPLNDLGPLPIASHDVMGLPPITTGSQSVHPPPVFGFFSQIKQEFVSARHLYYEGLNAAGTHYSDRDVLLYNTLDYPAYSLATEKMRTAFRVAYSILDKIGFFINEYFALGHDLKKITFRTVWYEPKSNKTRCVLPQFAARRNWPLRGLFWLSKDLYDEGFMDSTEPEAAALNEIRNHLEHKYLQLHQDFAMTNRAPDEFCYRLSVSEFAPKTLRLLQLARASLIYLSLAVHAEERHRKKGKPADKIVVPISIGKWDDDWKRLNL